MNQRKAIANQTSQHDETASDAAMLWDTLRTLDPAIRRAGLPPRYVQNWQQAIDLAYRLMVRTDGSALLMRAVIRLARRGRLEKNVIAQLRAYERAYPNELAMDNDECSPSYQDGVQAEDEHQHQHQQAVPVMAHPDFHHNSY
jgi:hypothetical protein